MPILQTVLSAGVIWAFTFVIGSISSFQAQLATQQTTQALTTQKLESVDRRVESNEKLSDATRMTVQRLDIQVAALTDSLKALVVSGRPK
jgi:hypothetical protein